MSKKLLVGAFLTIPILVISACGDDEGEGSNEQAEEDNEQAEEDASEQEGAAPEPDLEGIPDVVAVVNGNEIGRDEFVSAYEAQFEQQAMQAQASGQEIDQDQLKERTAESLVDNELLIQEADNRGFEATDEEMDETLDELAQQNGLESGDAFVDALTEQGMEEAEVMSQLEIQTKVDQLIADETGNIEPTEDELRELYEQAEEQQAEMGEGAELPPFDEVRPQLEQQATAEKEGEAVQALLGGLREGAEVDVKL